MTQRTLTCPNCGTAFDVHIVMSTNSFGGQTTDFRPVAAGTQPLAAMIHTCPSCGLTGMYKEFSGNVDREVRELIAKRLTPLVRDEQTVPSRRYEFAAWIAEWRGHPAETIAQHYLSAAWCCAAGERLSEADTEEYYRRQAIVYFERALAGDGLEAPERAVLTYLVGELYRRVGEKDEALRWFGQAGELAGASEETAWVGDVARRQATDPQDMF